jgi:hypothetical protein
VSSWWGEQCPARGPALTHAHWNKCDPKGYHPGTSDKHTANQCCECGLLAGTAAEPAKREETLRYATQDHRFKFTIGGCYHCGKPEEFHPVFLPDPTADECPVDHRSITTGILIGDDGLQWRACPVCHTGIEPALAEGFPSGPSYGPGRMPWVQRRWDRIVALKAAFDAGYYQS